MSSTAGNIFKKFRHQLSTEECIIFSGHLAAIRVVFLGILFFPAEDLQLRPRDIIIFSGTASSDPGPSTWKKEMTAASAAAAIPVN